MELVVSEPVFSEVREVLERPELKPRRQGRLTPRMVEDILTWILEHATFIREVPERFHYDRDPDDEPYLNLAIAAGAVYLVSRDKDLLDLQDPASAPGQELRQDFPQLSILSPIEFLRRFSPASEEDR